MKKKIIYNIIASLTLEIVTVICSFILPRMIISGFGSEYNGIVSSVVQFLSVVTLLRGGVGGVTRAALYKPLVENDVQKISSILKSTEHFMRKIVYIFVVFLLLFASGYPLLVSDEFGWFYTFTLVLILGITTISQYYFGITYQFLLIADQKSYIYNILQTIATILNTVFSVILINIGVEFRLMKLVSAMVFAAIPIAMYWYVHKKYTIIKDAPKDDSCIRQRWDAFVHQVAAFINTNTDLVLLTIFSNLYQVSVYNVYFMVVYGVRRFVSVFTSGVEASIGKMIASREKQMERFVNAYELGMNVVSTAVFACTAILIVPFMKVYMNGVTDADYIQPALGYCLVLGSFFACIRLPYQNIVESAGHFKETRNGALAEAAINIVISLALVGTFGAVGVALGTVFAMAFRTIQYAMYCDKQLLKRSYQHLLKRMLVTCFNIAVIIAPYFVLKLDNVLENFSTNYLTWVAEAFIVFAVVSIVSVLINILSCKNNFSDIIRLVTKSKSKCDREGD